MDKGEYFNCPRIDLATVIFTEALLAAVPKEMVLRYSVIPVSDDEVTLSIAMADPSDLDAIDALHFLLKREIEPRIADEHQLALYIQKLYGIGNDDTP